MGEPSADGTHTGSTLSAEGDLSQETTRVDGVADRVGAVLDEATLRHVSVLSRPPMGSARISGHITVRGSVGQGGMGRVLLGQDERIGRDVAVKELLTDQVSSPESVARFLREARITGRLEHPGIVPVHELGEQPDGRPYYVMKYVRGRTLADALADANRLPPDQAALARHQLLGNLIAVCDAMAYAHAQGVVHRDLKPGNIILGPFGETLILDWGLARTEAGDGRLPNAGDRTGASCQAAQSVDGPGHAHHADVTRQGDVLGTPAYMAPEQANPGLGPVDRRSDVFALGCILFHVLAGYPPVRGAPATVMQRMADDQPLPSARSVVADGSVDLAAICDHALAKSPSARFADAGAMAVELRAWRDGRLVSVMDYTPRQLMRRFVRRHRLVLGAAAVTALAILGGAALAIRFGLEANQARRVAEAAQQRAETALFDITTGSARTLAVAQRTADRLEAALDNLIADLRRAAVLLADTMGPLRHQPVSPAIAGALTGLGARHDHVLAVLFLDGDGIVRAVHPQRHAARSLGGAAKPVL